MMTASVFLGGSLFVLLIVNLYSFPLEKGSNPSSPYSRSNTNTAANVASNQGGPSASLSPGLVPYSAQYRGVLVPMQQPDLSRYVVQSEPTGYVAAGVSQPAQAGGYTAGSAQTGMPVQPAAGSNIGASSSTSNTNAAANVALSQGGPSAYSSVAVPSNTQYGGVPLQQTGLSQYAVQGVPATYASSSLSAPAQAVGSTAGSTQTGAAVQPQSEINWAVPPPKLGEETSPSAQGLASSTGDLLGPVLPPLPAYQPGELSHFEKAAEAGDYQSETEELGRRTVPATMEAEAAAAAAAAAGGLASPFFSSQQFGMGGLWGNPYPYFDFMFLTGQYPVGTVSHFSQNYEQGRDYAHSTHYLKDQPFFYPSFDQQIVTIPGGQSLQNPSLYTSPVLGGYYQGSTQTTQTPITGVLQIFTDIMDGESPKQEASSSTEATNHTDTNNNSNQPSEPEVLENKDLEEGAEGQEVMEAEKDTVSEEREKVIAGDTKKPQTEPESGEGDTEEASQDKDKASTGADVKDSESGEKDKEEEAEAEENKKGEQVEKVQSGETGRDGGDMKDKDKERSKCEKKEEVKDVNEKEAEKKKQVKKVDVEQKEKGKMKEAEKQAKPKRKSGPSSSSFSRPRPSARSIRASAKNDIIAKFQQGAPETPITRNFKIQKSSTAAATGASIKQKILQWCRNKTRNYEGINIENFSSSWCDGMAFCALIHRFFPDAFDYSSLTREEREKNFTLAFKTAESLADCCPLLEVSDMIMMGNNPDPMCVFTYVQSLCHSLSKIEKERKDKEKEEKEKAGNEGEEKEKADDAPGDVSPEKEDEEAAENETMSSQEDKPVDGTETEGTVEEESASKSCEVEEDEGVLVKAES